jgi:hypothetical protein
MESKQFIYRKGTQQIREVDNRCEGSGFCASPFVAGSLVSRCKDFPRCGDFSEEVVWVS